MKTLFEILVCAAMGFIVGAAAVRSTVEDTKCPYCGRDVFVGRMK